MKNTMITSIIWCVAALLVPPTSLAQRVNVLYEWNYLNFAWSSRAALLEALNSGTYIPESNIMTGIKVWKDQIYMSLPRWKQGVPATLVSVPANPRDGKLSPLLQPYPNWQMQRLGDCSALQFVMGMEIDPNGRMWVLENGRTEFRTERPRTECPTRLVILDLENQGRVLLDYRFPADVVNRNSVFLNDIVLDHEDGGWAYISDSDASAPGIVVFSLKNRRSWKVSHNLTMNAPQNPIRVTVNGIAVEIAGPIDGMALSPASSEGNRMVYYTPLSSSEMFTIPTKVLKNPRLATTDSIQSVGQRSSFSDGIAISARGNMYYGLVTEDSVSRWPISAEVFTRNNQELIFYDPNVNQWPDSFSIDGNGRLWWVPIRIPIFESNQTDISEPNYRVLFTDVQDRNYMYYNDFSSPNFPDIRENWGRFAHRFHRRFF